MIHFRRGTEYLFPSTPYSASIEPQWNLDTAVISFHWVVRKWLKIGSSDSTLHRFVISSSVSDASERKRQTCTSIWSQWLYSKGHLQGIVSKHQFHAHAHISPWTDVPRSYQFYTVWLFFALLDCSANYLSLVFNLIFWPFSFTPLHTWIWVMHGEEMRQYFIVAASREFSCCPAIPIVSVQRILIIQHVKLQWQKIVNTSDREVITM